MQYCGIRLCFVAPFLVDPELEPQLGKQELEKKGNQEKDRIGDCEYGYQRQEKRLNKQDGSRMKLERIRRRVAARLGIKR